MRCRVVLVVLIGAVAGCQASFRGEPAATFTPGQDINRQAVQAALSDPNIQAAVGPDATRALRNTVVLARMTEIDTLYNDYERQLGRELRDARFASALLGIGAGIGGTFVTGGASQVFSAGSTAIAGGSEAFEKEILVDRTVQALTSQMRASRDAIKAQILQSLTAEIDVYPTLAALSDLVAYRQAGTLVGAVLGISESAAMAEAEAREGLAKTQRRIVVLGNARDITQAGRDRTGAILAAVEQADDLLVLRLANAPPTSNEEFTQILAEYLQGQSSFTDVALAREALTAALQEYTVSDATLAPWEQALGIE